MTDQLPAMEPAPPIESLPASRLRHPCDTGQLPFDRLDELAPLDDHFGQDRAVEALEFGLEIGHEGFNVFVLGSTGIGKRELLETMLSSDDRPQRGELSLPPARPTPHDFHVRNTFKTPTFSPDLVSASTVS